MKRLSWQRGLHAAHVSLTEIYWIKILPHYFNPKTKPKSLICLFFCCAGRRIWALGFGVCAVPALFCVFAVEFRQDTAIFFFISHLQHQFWHFHLFVWISQLWSLASFHSLSVRIEDGESMTTFATICDFVHKFFFSSAKSAVNISLRCVPGLRNLLCVTFQWLYHQHALRNAC